MHRSIVIDGGNDDVIEIGGSMPTFKIPQRSFNAPVTGMSGPSLGSDSLINRRKVNGEVLSMSGSSSPSEYSETDSETRSQKGGGFFSPKTPSPPSYRQQQQPIYSQNTGYGGNNGSKVQSEDDDDDDDDDGGQNGQEDNMQRRFQAERTRLEQELQEKKEILYQMSRLESKGYPLPRKFSMQSDIEEMRAEYQRIVREKEIDASVRFQRKMMMALVTGVEFVNTRFDPFEVKLDGWSEQVHENIDDYDDIFEELHDKYKSTGKKMAPELRLFMSLSGSAFMFHLTNSMFKQSKLPDVEEVIRSDPSLMKHFQEAAMRSHRGGGGNSNTTTYNENSRQSVPQPPPPPQHQVPQSQSSRTGGGGGLGGGGGGLSGGLFSMVGSLLSGPTIMQQQQQQPRFNTSASVIEQDGDDDIENIIDNINSEIKVQPPQNMGSGSRIESMSVTDDEITSIIEDTADLNGILINGNKAPTRRGGGRKTTATSRTLNL